MGAGKEKMGITRGKRVRLVELNLRASTAGKGWDWGETVVKGILREEAEESS